MAEEGTGVFVTGGTGELGRTLVARFLTDGRRVAVTYRRVGEWQTLSKAHAAESGTGRLLGIRADLGEESSTRGAVDQAAAAFGGLSALVHLAGGYAGGAPVATIEEGMVRSMIESNLISAFWASKHAIPHLKRSGRGRLLFISSRGAVETHPGASAYAAAKAGLEALVLTLAKELRKDGITANAVRPSVIDTPANRVAMPDADPSAWVPPESIAALIAFLASEAAAPISGALIPIYGRA
jgi:NAD(P)-dependent dehydrogenase (short-subunit alcohol dehydrogenase family)